MLQHGSSGAQAHILLLTLHKPGDFAFTQWLGRQIAPGSLSLVLDEESSGTEAVAALRSQPEFGFVRAYGNYLNNGQVYADLESLHAERPISHVIAFGEDDIVRAARLRERWGLRGQRVDNALGFRDKSRMRRILADAGIPVHAGMALEHPLDLIDFVRTHRLPVFVKPRTSSGSVFGRKIGTDEQLREFLRSGFAPRVPYSEYVPDLCVETFQAGELHHVDGISVDGAVAWMWPSKYLTSGLEIGAFSEDVVVGSTMLAAENPVAGALREYVGRVCHALALPHGFTFHAEVFVDSQGGLSLCEISCRTGGGRVNETLASAGGPNLNQWQLLLQSGAASAGQAATQLGAHQPRTLCGWMLIPPRRGRCLAVPDLTGLPGVRAAALNIRPGEDGWERTYSGDSMGYLVVAGDSESQLHDRMRAAIKHVDTGLRFAS